MAGEWFYAQKSGRLSYVEGERAAAVGTGYSGHPPYVNEAEAQGLRAHGPIPRGTYRIRPAFDHVRLGPLAMYLEPDRKNVMFGRSGFFIHGDNEFGNRTASHGCIVLSRKVREIIVSKGLPATLVVG